MFCEAADLVKLPPVAPDPLNELVQGSGASLKEIAHNVALLQEDSTKLQALVTKVDSGLASLSAAPRSLFSEAVKGNSVNSVASANYPKGAAPPAQHKKRSEAVIIFGLPEVGSLPELKYSVDKLLQFMVNKHVAVSDLFRLGHVKSPSSSVADDKPRPVLLKFCSSWDRRLVFRCCPQSVN